VKATTHRLLWTRATLCTLMLVGGIGEAAAAPVIVSQPRRLAVDQEVHRQLMAEGRALLQTERAWAAALAGDVASRKSWSS
jgi:hypothetical protein